MGFCDRFDYINVYIFSSGTKRNRNCFIPMNYIEIFLEALSAEKGRSPKTLESYANDLYHANEQISKGLIGATSTDIQKYLSELPDKASSIARKASALRGFYKFLMLDSKLLLTLMRLE